MSELIKCQYCLATLPINDSKNRVCCDTHCQCRQERGACVGIVEGPRGPQGVSGERGEQGATGPKGDQGERGEKGDRGEQGAVGATGPQGDPATNFTATHMSAIHTGGLSLNVTADGIDIPFTGTKILSGFTANAASDQYTVGVGGTYYLSYGIKITTETTVRARVMRNGALLSGTVRLSSVPTSDIGLSLIVRLNEGDVISLQLYGPDLTVNLQGGTGASLVLIRLN